MTAYPAPIRFPSATSRFWRLSSTTRTVGESELSGARDTPTALLFVEEERLDDSPEGARVDRLREVALEPAAEEPLPIARHRQGGHGDDGGLGELGPRPRVSNHGFGAAAGNLDVQQQQIEPAGVERAPGLVDRRRFHHLVAAQLQEIVQQQPVERVVLDDERSEEHTSELQSHV